MKHLILLILLLLPFALFGQQKLLLKDVHIDEHTIMVGMYPIFDKSKIHENYNFMIKDQSILDSLKNSLSYGAVEQNIIDLNSFSIKILKKNEIVESWIVNPAHSNILIDGVAYDFKIGALAALSQKHHFKYSFYEEKFNSQKDFDLFQAKVKKDSSFLFLYKPDFRFEGTFEVKFMKSANFSSPKGICEYLDKDLKKISDGKEFRVSYVVNQNNLMNSNQFTMTIEGSNALFQKYKDKNSEKKEWIPNTPTATILNIKE